MMGSHQVMSNNVNKGFIVVWTEEKLMGELDHYTR